MTDDLRTLQDAADRTNREARIAKRALRQRLAAEELAKLAGRSGEATPRLSMSPARRARIIAKSGGCCAYPECPITTGLEIDHTIPLELGGREDDSNLVALCIAHHKAKTRLDIKLIAKARRIVKKATEPRKPSTLKGRGFEQARKSQWGRR